jgi:hypothetical protein
VPRSLRIASLAWLLGSAAWIVKVLLIWSNGGSNTDGGAVGAAFWLGLLALAVGGGAAGYALLRRRGRWLGVAGAVLGVVATWVVVDVVDGVLEAIVPVSGWFEDELGMVGSAVLALALAAAVSRRVLAARVVTAADAA